jgi:two-component system response regulator QseB
MRILLIEDDPIIRKCMEHTLRAQRYAVDWVRDGASAETVLDHDIYDLVVLDLNLPGREGMDVLRRYRWRGGQKPVLVVSARDGMDARVAGLDAGADDFLVKSFDIDEMHARIRALLRRGSAETQAIATLLGLAVDLANHEATFDGVQLHLTAREFSILRALLKVRGSVVTKASLEDKVYGWGTEIESYAIDVYIHQLRKKLGTDFIKNVRGVGYKLANPA